jgi:hypothetical protein
MVQDERGVSMIAIDRVNKTISVPRSSWDLWTKAAVVAKSSKIAFIVAATDFAAKKVLEKKGK